MRPVHTQIRQWLMLFTLTICGAVAFSADRPSTRAPHWEIAGDLTEACTCGVPCTCNFHEGPSPHHYCWSPFAIAIDKDSFGDVKLDGLHLAGAHGKKARVWYIDDHSTPEQAAALKAIAAHIDSKPTTHVETAHIVQEVGDKGNKLEIGDKGGFEAHYVMGMDGKNPIVVENNTSWNISKSIKGKTVWFRYKDHYGTKYDRTGTNSNQGKFEWTDQTKKYF